MKTGKQVKFQSQMEGGAQSRGGAAVRKQPSDVLHFNWRCVLAASCLLVAVVLLAGCGDTVARTEPAESGSSSVAGPAPYVFEGEAQAAVEDRVYSLECTPQTPAEGLVAQDYYYKIVGDYAALKSHYGENEALQIGNENERKQFEDGIYSKTYTIHTLSTLAEDELTDTSRERVAADVEEYGLTDYQIVEADISMEWNEAALAQGPQLGSGDYSRIFLCGVTDSDTAWKIYELYWGEYFKQ